MTNVNDTEADLGLAVSILNQWLNGNTAAGAGANANSGVDMMTFVGSDALPELVWSPRTGLSIKFADKKPCFMWEVGPSDMGFLWSEDTGDQKHVTEGHSVASQAICHVNGVVAKSSSSVETPRSISHGHPADPLSEHLFEDGKTGSGDSLGSDMRSPLKIEVAMQCGPEEHFERGKGKMGKDGCFSNPFLENAQDDLLENEKRAERGHSVPGEDRERSFSCQGNDEKCEDESHGSMEGCSSANLLMRQKRRLSFEQLILGSKRIKKQTQESVVKKDSSFMNWISNMVKGLKNYENYDREISVRDETGSFESRKMGFQNVFQSLFSTDAKAQATIMQIENKYVSSSKEVVLADKYSHGSVDCLEIKGKRIEGLLKPISLYERVTKEAPKGMFDTIRRLRLSRTDIIKWTNSRLSVAHLDGFFLRVRLAKWEEGAGGARYYVACITGSQGENPWKGFKKPICVNVGGVECFVESQYVSNCDFLEDELVAWWQKASKSGGTPVLKDLKSKIAERKRLGL